MNCSHTISSGRWNTLLLAANSTDRSDRGTILEALTTWMSLAGSGTIGYRDTCQGTHGCTYAYLQVLCENLHCQVLHVHVCILGDLEYLL